MSALGGVVRAGVGRRRVQTLVMTLTVTMAVTASVLAAGLVVASRAPFANAFARQNGAHLTVLVDGAAATAPQVAATARAPGVATAAGPDPMVSLRPAVTPGAQSGGPFEGRGVPPGMQLPPMTIAGRDRTGGGIDRLDLAEGRWANARGQIVVSADGPPVGIGDRLTFTALPGRPALTVVGRARSVSRTADAWVSPQESAVLGVPGVPRSYQMRYRLHAAATDADLARARAAITAALPRGALDGATSYLRIKLVAERTSATFVPFVVAFGVLGLAMSILIIVVVVSGAVSAATRRIGILKSLGFTPAQVVRAYVVQALLPATAGTALGVVLANLLAIPVMRQAEDAYGAGSLTIAVWVDVAVSLAALAVVGVTALVPALRAGRLRTIDAIAVGRTSRTAGRGRGLRRVLGGLPLPRPVSLGLADPFSRPARSATMVASVVLGTAGVTFCAGLLISLHTIEDSRDRRSPGEVIVHAAGPPQESHEAPPPNAPEAPGRPPGAAGKGPGPAEGTDPAVIAAKIAAQPGTRAYFSTARTQVGVAGRAGTTNVQAYAGDASWGSFAMISGRWFRAPGEAVVPTGFLKATGTRVGDTVTLTDEGRSAPVRIVGEALDLSDEGMTVLTPAASLAALRVEIPADSVQFNVDLAPGTEVRAYLASLNTTLRPLGSQGMPNTTETSVTIIAMDTLAGMLTLVLVAVAGLGVLNTVVLDTRERTHDLGVVRALGMTPGQTTTMVLTSVAGIGLVAGAAGVPLGLALHARVLPVMGESAGTGLPAEVMDAYSPLLLAVLLLGGLAIATAGALLPATWAARIRTASALRTE
ncbi:FtsX-like permease family protein [Spirillospora sp. NPDC047279]|uniref:FtsX-like permease family protein n=1 Tax=Spirillospora sp. NPDC047279 TaxID=3155478 RepID=UPI0033CC089E